MVEAQLRGRIHSTHQFPPNLVHSWVKGRAGNRAKLVTDTGADKQLRGLVAACRRHDPQEEVSGKRAYSQRRLAPLLLNARHRPPQLDF
jgi:hypothetical protein